MSASDAAIARALGRLGGPEMVLAPLSGANGYGVFAGADRRRRPLARLSLAQVSDLAAEGAIARRGGENFVITAAGRARLRRGSAAAEERFLAQHAAITTRTIIDGEGGEHIVRGVEGAAALKRLACLRAADGARWLAADELAAAARLHEDWRLGQAGLVGGSDWTAPPRGAVARGPGNGREGALARYCDARSRVEEALAGLALPLRRVVERVCLHEQGLEALERQEGWPARSGRIALKLGLAQLAAGFRGVKR